MLSRHKRQAALILFIVLAVFFVYRTRMIWVEIAAVLSAAVLLAMTLTPVCCWMEKRRIPKGAAALCSMIGFLMLLLLFLMVFVPYLLTSTVLLIRRLTPTILDIIDRLNGFLSQMGHQDGLVMNLSQLLSTAITPISAWIAKGGAAVVSAAGGLVMALIIAYYLLIVRSEAAKHLLLCIPVHYREVFIRAMKGSKNAVMSYLSGMFKTCAFVAAATFAGLIALGIGDALILSLLMGILEVIPYVGPILGMIPILLSALPMGVVRTLLAIALVLIIQQVESGVIGPYFTASSTSIHPLTAILGVFVAGSLFGLAGIVFAVPAIVVTRSVLWSIRSASIHSDS